MEDLMKNSMKDSMNTWLQEFYKTRDRSKNRTQLMQRMDHRIRIVTFDGQQRHSEINGRLLRKLASDPIQSTWRSVWRNIANGIPSSLILSRDDAAFVVCRWFRGIILSPLPFPQVLFSSSLSESVSCFDDNWTHDTTFSTTNREGTQYTISLTIQLSNKLNQLPSILERIATV